MGAVHKELGETASIESRSDGFPNEAPTKNDSGARPNSKQLEGGAENDGYFPNIPGT